MTDAQNQPSPAASPASEANRNLDWATAEDAYHLVNGLLAQVTAANDLIVLLATLLGEDRLKPVVETPQWAQYQAGRRQMEQLQATLDKFSATMQRLAANQPDRIEADASEPD
ncbi:MAG: hypothetical protein SNJ67_03290 [Chloracidobacterium sp.]|uniref:Uncharacterized protein n=1 Tax=Chloracidobacterium validum TaxID=2821543 RepID=A0ABX8B9E1_9BACT|nr:hypothetical protein [Chloracidobacterium validum]QUW02294.1 hypothetical protein J8C06_07970 [Chloracidobacterium validum]